MELIETSQSVKEDGSSRAYQHGYDACIAGARLEENPYGPLARGDGVQWQRGWLAAFRLVYGRKSPRNS